MKKLTYTLPLLLLGVLPLAYAGGDDDIPSECYPPAVHDEDTSGYYLNVTPTSVMPGDTVTAEAGSSTADPKTLRITIVWYDDNDNVVQTEYFTPPSDYDYNYPYEVTSTYIIPAGAEPNTTWRVVACFEYDDGSSVQYTYDIRVGSFMVVPEFLIGSIGAVISALGVMYAYKVKSSNKT